MIDNALLDKYMDRVNWKPGEREALNKRLAVAQVKINRKGQKRSVKRILRAQQSRKKTIPPKWIDGVVPPTFGDFCEQLDGLFLYERQERVFQESELWTAEQFMNGERDVNECILLWGKGSLSGDTPIKDELTKITRTVREWHESGDSLSIKSLGPGGVCIVRASDVYCKGKIDTVLVSLADGRQSAVSPDHRYLTRFGWVKAKDLRLGIDELVCSPQHDALYDSTLLSRPDYQSSCDLLLRPCDAHLHQPEGHGQGAVPLLSGALAPPPCGDGPDNLQGCVPIYTSPFQVAGSWGARNHEVLVQPLLSSDCAESSLLAPYISLPVQQVLDRYCSLPLPEQQEILNAFSFLKGAPGGGDSPFHIASFSQSLLPLMRENVLPCRELSCHQYTDAVAPSHQSEPAPRTLDSRYGIALDDCVLTECLPENDQQSAAVSSYGYTDLEALPPQYEPTLIPLNYSSCEFVSCVAVDTYKYTDFYDITVPVTQCYFDANGILHHNSGKDWIVARFIAWVSYIVLSLEGPAGPYFGLNPTDKLYIINVAPTGNQAREIFFAYLEANFRCAIFNRFFPSHADQILQDEVRFWWKDKIKIKRLFVFSRNSNSSGLEGYNVLAWIMDEADDFKITESGSKAVTIRKQFRSSAATRMGNRSVGLIISYPRTEDGFMMSLCAEVRADIENCRLAGKKSSFYLDVAATWDVRPDITLATNKIMQQDYASDARLARAMYEVQPMAAVDAFFDFPERILRLTDPTYVPLIDAYTEIVETEMDNGTLDQAISILAHWNKTVRQAGKAYFFTADGGLKGDAYAICIMSTDQSSNAWLWVCPECQRENPESMRVADYHLATPEDAKAQETINCGCCGETPYFYHHSGIPKDWMRRGGFLVKPFCYGTKEFHIPMIQEEFVFAIDPVRPTGPGKHGIIVDFPGVFTFIEKAAQILRPEQIRVDPWNHASLIQGLKRSTHMDVDEMSFSNTDQFKRARLCKTLGYAGLVSLVKNDRRDKQWTRLVRKGGRVDHPLGGEKDLYDSESMAIWLAAVYNDKAIEFAFS